MCGLCTVYHVHKNTIHYVYIVSFISPLIQQYYGNQPNFSQLFVNLHFGEQINTVS